MNTAFQVRYVIELPLDSTAPLVFYERRKKGEEKEKKRKSTKSGEKRKENKMKDRGRFHWSYKRNSFTRGNFSIQLPGWLYSADLRLLSGRTFQYASLMNMNFVKGVEEFPAWKFCSFGKIVSPLEDRKQCFLRSRRYNAIYVIERWCSRGFERAPFVYEETAMFP